MYFCLCLFYYVMCCLLNISVSYSIVQIQQVSTLLRNFYNIVCLQKSTKLYVADCQIFVSAQSACSHDDLC